MTVGDLVKRYREARAQSDRAVKPKSNEDYIVQRLQDAFESHFASRLTTQQIVKFAQDRRKAGARGPLPVIREIQSLEIQRSPCERES